MKVLKIMLLVIGLAVSSFIALFVYFVLCDLFDVQLKHPIQFAKQFIASTIQPLPFKYNSNQLLGPRDNNKVGIRNDIYTYIVSNPKLNENQKKVMFHGSAILDQELDFTKSREDVRRIAYYSTDFLYCYEMHFHGSYDDIKDLTRAQLNTIERITAYLKFNSKAGGSYRVIPDSCICEKFLNPPTVGFVSCERTAD